MWIASFILSWKLVEAWSKIWKQSTEHGATMFRILVFEMWEALSLTNYSRTRLEKCRGLFRRQKKKNLFPAHLIIRVVNRYITGTLSNQCPRGSLPLHLYFYFKLLYISHFLSSLRKNICHLIKRYCNDLNIKLFFSSFKIGNLFGVKDPIPGGLRHGSRVVYKFACAGCNACYVGETARHFFIRVRERLSSDEASYIFKHLQNSEHCRALCSVSIF